MKEVPRDESASRRARREFEPAYLGLGGVLWTALWAALAIAATIYFSAHHSLGAQVAIGVGFFIAGIAVAAITTFGMVWMRSVVRQRDEARAQVAELTQPFPDVVIETDRFREDWQDHLGNRIDEPRTYRAWFPVVVTNRERERRLSLRFYVTINAPDGSGVLVTHFPTEQEDELPLVVDPQNSKRIELSVFTNDYLTAGCTRRRDPASTKSTVPTCSISTSSTCCRKRESRCGYRGAIRQYHLRRLSVT